MGKKAKLKKVRRAYKDYESAAFELCEKTLDQMLKEDEKSTMELLIKNRVYMYVPGVKDLVFNKDAYYDFVMRFAKNICENDSLKSDYFKSLKNEVGSIPTE